MSNDIETPSIVVEPPRDEIEDLIDGGRNPSLNSTLGGDFQALYGVFPDSTSSSRNTSTEQGLFSTPLEHSPLSSGQVSPLITTGLRDASSGNMFLSASGQNSPIDAWSPVSTSSGDAVFPDTWSDCSSSWSPSVESSSPSSPSLSPINSSMLHIHLNEAPMLDDNAGFNQGPSMYRIRSNSYSGGSDSPPESGGARPRSASFTNPQIAGGTGLDAAPQISQQFQWDPSFQDASMTTFVPGSPIPGHSLDNTLFVGNNGASYGSPSSSNFSSPTSSESWHYDLPAQPIPSIMFQPPPGPPPQNPMSSASHSRSLSTHLTVPSSTHSLQRRGAHRRSHSHTGVHEPTSPSSPSATRPSRGHPSGRGRSPGPSAARHSRTPSLTRDPAYSPIDPSASFIAVNPANQIPNVMTDISSFLPSPTPSSAGSSPVHSPITHPIEINVTDSGAGDVPVINVDDYDSSGLARRHSYGGGSQSPEPSPTELHRAASDPVGRGRKARSRTVPRRFPGLLRPQKEVDESMQFRDLSSLMMDVPIEGIASTSSSPTPASSDNEHKEIVASTKIVDASSKRRKKPGEKGRFVCHICGHDFTAKHNLNNHMNSHSGIKPHKCVVCGQTFTTSGTAKRHQSNCGGRPPRKRP